MQPEHVAGQPYEAAVAPSEPSLWCPTPSPAWPPISMLAGRYRILPRLLGRGALAEVWAGTDELLNRPVAVKLFSPGTETAEKQRFSQEARTLAGLSHSHLIALYDAGEADGRAYLVMRQVSGGTLGAELRARGSLPAETVRRIGAQVASALGYIERRGIVHRDVKPANILLDSSGDAVLADFGIARLIDGTRLTSTGITIGTAAYLSPEQVRGAQVGPPADVYALGLVLLEALTGRREYPGDPIEAAVARLHRRPAVPPHLPYGLSALLRDMTADEPADRPSAEQVAEQLGQDVPTVPAQLPGQRSVVLRGAQAVPPADAADKPGRLRQSWLVAAAIAVGATGAAVLGFHSLDSSGTTAHVPAVAGSSTAPASSTSPSAAQQQPAAAASAASSIAPASLPHKAIQVTPATSSKYAAPPGPPGRGKGHNNGHGKGAHKPHG